MNTTTPVWQPVHLAPQTLLEVIRAPYTLSKHAQCDYLTSGLHHLYRVTDQETVRICRVYRRAWRSRESALYELDILDQLRQMGCPVSYPIATRDSELAIEADTPLGQSTVAIFTYAAGAAPGSPISLEQARLLGGAVATLHFAMARVTPRYHRPVRDLVSLIDDPLRALTPMLAPQDHAQLRADIGRIKANLPALSSHAPFFGLLHGDINLKNTHFFGQHLTFIDFDDCGSGWYAFEIGKFYHACSHLVESRPLQSEFLSGYQRVRPLQPVEIQAIPYFVLLAHVWVMAVHAYNAEYLSGYLSPAYWQRKMQRWRRLCVDVFSPDEG